MGFLDTLKDQFLDVIEFEDKTNKLIVFKFKRESGNNELKQGSKVIVREGQAAIFLKGGRLADVLKPGTYSLKTENFPLLTKMEAFPYLFISPVVSDVYFVSTRQFVDNKWATKNPIVKRDEELSMVRIRAFGKFGFRISDPATFMREVFGSKGIVMSYDILQYLSSMVTEAFSIMVGESSKSILDLSSELRNFSSSIQDTLNKQASQMGIQFSDILIENISLPDEVEKLMDERSGVGMVQKDMSTFVKYQTARAMREASGQEAGIAGLGAGFALGKTLAQNIENADNSSGMPKGKVEQLRELKALLDEGILTQEEFEIEKKDILKK